MRIVGATAKDTGRLCRLPRQNGEVRNTTEVFTEHSPALTAQIPSAVGGQVRVIQNGQRGAGNGVVVYPRAQME